MTASYFTSKSMCIKMYFILQFFLEKISIELQKVWVNKVFRNAAFLKYSLNPSSKLWRVACLFISLECFEIHYLVTKTLPGKWRNWIANGKKLTSLLSFDFDILFLRDVVVKRQIPQSLIFSSLSAKYFVWKKEWTCNTDMVNIRQPGSQLHGTHKKLFLLFPDQRLIRCILLCFTTGPTNY